MSCIYGPHQFGNEDQGWVAHFLDHALPGEPLTIYGDGAQVRDVLYVGDLVDAFLLRRARTSTALGATAFNIGGGPGNLLSLLQLLQTLEQFDIAAPAPALADWRPADQRYYVSDFRRFQQATGWTPQHNVQQGLNALLEWLVAEGPAAGAWRRPPAPRRLGGIT